LDSCCHFGQIKIQLIIQKPLIFFNITLDTTDNTAILHSLSQSLNFGSLKMELPTREQLEDAIKDIAVLFQGVSKEDLSFTETDIVMILVELGYLDNDPVDSNILDYPVFPR